MRSTLTALAYAVVFAAVALAFFAWCLSAAGSLLTPNADAEPLDETDAAPPVSGPRAAVGTPAGVAAAAAQPERDPVIGTDAYTAERHARIRAFQQRETAERSARSFMTRGF